MMGLLDGQRSFKIGLAVFRHNTGVWRTAGQTDTERQQRPRYAEGRAGKNDTIVKCT